MTANSFLAGCVLGLMAGACSIAQDCSPASHQPPPPPSSPNRAHRTAHHIQVPVEDSPSPELAQAETAIENRDYAVAEPLLLKAVNEDSASYVAWFDLGFVENALGKVEDSIVAYRKSVATKPDVFESNLNLGLQLARTGHPDAEVFLRAATQLKPSSHAAEGQYRAWISLAQTIAKTKPEDALAAYQHAETLQPKEAEPHISSGQLFDQEQKPADAEQEYKLALALDPHATDAVIGLANIYMRGRRFPEAEDYLRKLVADHADPGPVHSQLGRVLAAEGKNDAAIAELQAGIKASPNDEAAQRDLAELYSTVGKNDLAEVAYREMIASHSDDAELHRRLGQALLRQKKFPEAQHEFIAAVKLKPGLGEAYGDLAFAANENKDYPLAIRALDTRARLLPEIPITYFLRATAYDHLRDFKNASANYHLFLNVAGGKYPDQEWQAKHRLIAIEPKK